MGGRAGAQQMTWDGKLIDKPGTPRTIELRKQFSRPISRLTCDFGQMLVKVTKGSVRISMNGPCNLTSEQWEEMKDQLDSARAEI